MSDRFTLYLAKTGEKARSPVSGHWFETLAPAYPEQDHQVIAFKHFTNGLQSIFPHVLSELVYIASLHNWDVEVRSE